VFVVTRERFEEFVADALDSIPAEFADRVENVAILIEDDSARGNLLGLYEGVPITKRWHYSGAMPDRITLFQDAICRMCRTEDEVRRQVHDTLVHELGHYFGIDDARLAELGW
jgi:predicted Zn-dependent protease with MMP-like domain